MNIVLNLNIGKRRLLSPTRCWTEENGAGGIEFDGDRDRRRDQQHHRQQRQRDREISEPLHKILPLIPGNR